MSAIRFSVPGEPVGKGRPIASTFSGHVQMRTPERTVNYEAVIAMHAARAMDGAPPLVDAVSLFVTIVHSPPISWSARKRARAMANSIACVRKPDFDNVLKSIGDAANGVVWLDDKQIVSGTWQRLWGDAPRIDVVVTGYQPPGWLAVSNEREDAIA